MAVKLVKMLKILCNHKWETHAKEKYEWKEKQQIKGTEYWFAPMFEEIEYSKVEEILICQKCGKIKELSY